MVILHFIDVENIEGNGVAVAVKSYLKIENEGNSVAIFDMCSHFNMDNIETFYYTKYKKIADLPKPYNKPDIVVFNEIYKTKYLGFYKECLKSKIPYIIIPHGSLVRMAQKKHRIKKILGNHLFFCDFINKANAIQFLSENEKNETKFKYKKSIIISNGVFVDEQNCNKPANNDLIYIGRYDINVKGLDLLIKTCGKYRKWFLDNDIKIQLYGRTTGKGTKTIDNLKYIISKYRTENIVQINDAIYGKEKEKLIKKSYAFIQTSRHEGQPMGIIEALSLGVPCIVTEGTGFSDILNKNKCGFGVHFDADELFEAIKEIQTNFLLRNEMSDNAYNVAKENYDWNNIKKKIITEYITITKNN